MDVMRRAVPRAVHVWDRDADERLLDAVKVYGVENWSLGSSICTPYFRTETNAQVLSGPAGLRRCHACTMPK